MPRYKLLYFNVRARGELPRLIFAQAGQEFVDERVKDWDKLKPTMPLKALPVLVVDGESIPETMSIVRFLATRFNLRGKTDIQNARIDSILDACADFLSAMAGAVFEKDEEVKKKKMDKLHSETAPTTLKYIESIIQANNKDWTVGDKDLKRFTSLSIADQEGVRGLELPSLTVADLAIYDYFYNASKKNPNFLDSYPGIQKIRGKVEALPKIAKWIKERPESDF